MAFCDESIELGSANLDQREFCRDEEAVQHDQEEHGHHLEGGHEYLVEIHFTTFSPNITRRMSCRLTMPSSRRSRARTIARRCPACCMRRNASSTRTSSSRKSAGLRKS